MPRSTSPWVDFRLEDIELGLALLVQIQLADDSYIRVWSGVGTLTHDGESWTGVGSLGSMGPVGENLDLEAQGVTFQLAGTEAANLAAALGSIAPGKEVSAWLGLQAKSGAGLLADPIPVWEGFTDTPGVQLEGATATISLTSESRLIEGRKARGGRYTAQDQQQDWPGDQGFDLVPYLQDKEIVFG